jgi:RNA polymerase sigma-70 factor, ECF subfamily
MSYQTLPAGCAASTITEDETRCDKEVELSSTPSDGELLMEYAERGDREAFAELVRRHERKLFNYLRRYIGDAQLAEDAFQATFLQVHLKCRQFQRGRALAPWLYQIATNQAIDLLRRNRRHRAFSLDRAPWNGGRGEQDATLLEFLEETEMQPGERMEAAEDRRRVAAALEGMPDRARQLLTLVLFQGLKYREAAEVLGIPVGTVKSQMHEAVRTLKDRILFPVQYVNG